MGWLRNTFFALGIVFLGGAWSCPEALSGSLPEVWRLAATNPEARSEALAALEAERTRGAYGDIAPLAAALLAEARRAADPRVVEGLATLAATAAPADPRPRAFLAGFYLGESFRPSAALQNAWGWARAVTIDPWLQAVAVLRVGAVLTLAAWIGATALVLVGAAAFGTVLFHDYRDSFPRRFRRHVPPVLALLVGAVLWTVGSGPAVFLLLFGLALSPYLPGRGRGALGLLLAVGCLMPQGLGGLAGLGANPGDRAWALYRVWRGDAAPELAEQLDRLFPEADGRVHFARARVARREGSYDSAEEHLQHALALPGVPASVLRTELGTLRFVIGDGEGALEEFQRAAEADPTAALPWLGRHVVHLERLELGLADEALERARALGAQSVDRTQSGFAASSRHIAPVAPAMPAAWVRAEALSGPGGSRGWVAALVHGVFLPINVMQPAALGLLAIGVILAGGQAGVGRRSRRCPSCGFVVCPRCGRRVKGSELCPACWASAREEAADNAERERQARDVEKWQARSERWRGVGRAVLPGWAEFLLGGGVRNLCLGLAWAGAASMLLLAALYPVALLPWGRPSFPWVAAVVFAMTYGIGLQHAATRRGPR